MDSEQEEEAYKRLGELLMRGDERLDEAERQAAQVDAVPRKDIEGGVAAP
jgi:hypothetical protein